LITEADQKYVERIGRPPAPMTDDYSAAVARSRVWMLESAGGIVGALVTEDRADHLLLETVAVAPTAQGSGYGRLLLDRAPHGAPHRPLVPHHPHHGGQRQELLVLRLLQPLTHHRAASLESSNSPSRAFCELYDASDRSLLAFIDPIVCGNSAVSFGARSTS